MENVVQLNVRMAEELRDAGNDALRSVGMTPSELVRAIWSMVAQRGEALKRVVDLVHGAEETPETQLEGGDLALLEGQQLYVQALRELGVRQDVAAKVLCDEADAIDAEAALLEKWVERGLLDG